MASGKILVVMSDLFFSAKINDAAKKLGLTAEFVKDKALALEKAKSNPPLIILDLNWLDLNCESAEPLDLIARLKADAETAGVPIVGFISHVQVDRRQAAQDAGCDVVVARSAFARNLPAILERYATTSRS